jgi:biopolymer transport protein ExbB/TolQ
MRGLAEFLKEGGPFMYMNALCSVVVIGIILDRTIFVVRQGSVNAGAVLEQLRKLVQANSIDRAIRFCSAGKIGVLRVARAGLVQLRRGEEAISTGIEEALADALPDMKKRVSALWALANIATLLGLLGTVTGLIRAFKAVGFASPEERSTLLAAGVSEAMNNTAVGLGIAVTAIIGHLLLSSSSKKMASDLETFAMKMENMLVFHWRALGASGGSVPSTSQDGNAP